LGLAVFPFKLKGNLHHLVTHASCIRIYANNRTVIHQKLTGDPIKLQRILWLIDHVDVTRYDASGVAELQSTDDRRKVLARRVAPRPPAATELHRR
jgi:hypothetical protein